MKYQQLSLTPQDQQLLETRRFGIEQICRWFLQKIRNELWIVVLNFGPLHRHLPTMRVAQRNVCHAIA